jgi:hypothetical protein
MSLENSIDRIAVALEGLLAIAAGGKPPAPEVVPSKTAAKVQAVPKTKTKPISPVTEAELTPPMVEEVDTQGPGQFDEPTVAPAAPAATGSMPTTTDGLLTFAGQFLNAAPEGVAQTFLAFIRNTVSAKYCPTDPRLRNVPVKNIPEAAQAIEKWAKEHGITISKEV